MNKSPMFRLLQFLMGELGELLKIFLKLKEVKCLYSCNFFDNFNVKMNKVTNFCLSKNVI